MGAATSKMLTGSEGGFKLVKSFLAEARAVDLRNPGTYGGWGSRKALRLFPFLASWFSIFKIRARAEHTFLTHPDGFLSTKIATTKKTPSQE